MCVDLDIAADLLLQADMAPDSEDILDKSDDVGLERVDFSEWEEHALERTEWDSVRASADEDDWESTLSDMSGVFNESTHEGGSPLNFG